MQWPDKTSEYITLEKGWVGKSIELIFGDLCIRSYYGFTKSYIPLSLWHTFRPHSSCRYIHVTELLAVDCGQKWCVRLPKKSSSDPSYLFCREFTKRLCILGNVQWWNRRRLRIENTTWRSALLMKCCRMTQKKLLWILGLLQQLVHSD